MKSFKAPSNEVILIESVTGSLCGGVWLGRGGGGVREWRVN